jgi:GxxExxY protein
MYIGALEHECRKRGLHVGREVPVAGHCDGVMVGTYRVDLLIERRLVLEIKACAPHDDHALLNYLRSTEVEPGLLLYFGRRGSFRRFVFRNALKRHIERKRQSAAISLTPRQSAMSSQFAISSMEAD